MGWIYHRHFIQHCLDHLTLVLMYDTLQIALEIVYVKLSVKNNESFRIKTRVIGTATKGHKQVSGLQSNALPSLIHFVRLHSKSEIGM